MTDKEKKSKIGDILLDFYDEYNSNEINRPMIPSVYVGKILEFLQKEPVNVWHDYKDPIDIDRTILIVAPNVNSSLALWSGKDLLSTTLGGGHRVLCKGDKWAYIDELIKK